MVVMIICGIQPVENCTAIPDEAVSLTSPRPATRKELENARVVLREWLLYKFSDEWDELPPHFELDEVLGAEVNLVEFCIECEDADLRKKAPLFTEFVGVNSSEKPYLISAADHVAESRDLKKKIQFQEEIFERLVMGKKQNETYSDVLTNPPETNSITTKVAVITIRQAKAGRPAVVETLIQAAEQMLGEYKNDANALYEKCMDLAEENPKMVIGYTLRTDFSTRSRVLHYTLISSGNEKLYPKRLISERIKRRMKKLEENDRLEC